MSWQQLLTPETQHLAMWCIFGLTYVGIALGGFPYLVLDRTGVALLGAIAMLTIRGLTIAQTAAHVDYETILLLFGLMLFSAQLRVAGFYALTGGYLTRLTNRPRLLLAGLIATSAVLSALLANDIVCLAFTPLLCTALIAAKRDPVPYLLALATSANIGSAATIIGNPQNMYIGTVAKLPFGHFALIMLLPVVIGLILCWLGTVLLFKHQLDSPPGARAPKHALKAGDTLGPSSHPLNMDGNGIDSYLIGKTLIILVALIVCFLTVHGEWRAICTLTGAAILLCSRRAKAAKLYQYVDWNLILLFLGLFVLNGAMKEQGLTQTAFGHVAASGIDLQNLFTLSSVTLALSNLVSNVPAVILLQTTIQPENHQAWYLLALVSTWAGNLTLVGSIANLIVAESASAYGIRLDLKTYCRLGIPLTLITVVLGTLWLWMVM
jgi:Na+/H+ antiporter NhaD/arsenite permease-like protein